MRRLTFMHQLIWDWITAVGLTQLMPDNWMRLVLNTLRICLMHIHCPCVLDC